VVRASCRAWTGRDIQVTVDGDTLTIHAERREEHTDKRRSEFRYGSLTDRCGSRQPDAKDVTARYDRESWKSASRFAGQPGGRQIEIEHAG